jgi:hypothetical protein
MPKFIFKRLLRV